MNNDLFMKFVKNFSLEIICFVYYKASGLWVTKYQLVFIYIEMDHRNVYAEYNVELVLQLKMKDPIFIAMLTKQRLFFGELKAKMREQSTEAEASSLFLHEVIERSLESNDPEPFMKLLSAMDQFGGPLEKLSAEMRKCLKSTTRTNTTNQFQSTDILGKYLTGYIIIHMYNNVVFCTLESHAALLCGITT